MAAPGTGTCEPWATEADLCTPCDDYEGLGQSAEQFLQGASDALYVLSGRQFPGECEVTVRPCARRGTDRPPTWHRSWGACGCSGSCGCLGSREIQLGAYPIVDIVEVKVDGVILDPARYRVDEHRYLIRQADPDGSSPGWPTWQRLELPDDEEGTWSVTFVWGRPPPQTGVTAAAVLACELAKACQPEQGEGCRLPKKVQSLARQGVQIVMTDLATLLSEDRTGIPEVDLFIKTYNPEGLRRPAMAWSPDVDAGVRRSDT